MIGSESSASVNAHSESLASRFLGIQAVADGTASAGLVLFVLAAADFGTTSNAFWGVILLLLAGVLRISLAVSASRRLRRLNRGAEAPWMRWLYGLYAIEFAGIVAGIALVSFAGVTPAAAVVVTFLIGAVASSVCAGRAARAAGGSTMFVDSLSVHRYA
jgi:hypothetical protein